MDVYLLADDRLFYSLSFENACGLKYHAVDDNHRGRTFDWQTCGPDDRPTDIWATDNCVSAKDLGTVNYRDYFKCIHASFSIILTAFLSGLFIHVPCMARDFSVSYDLHLSCVSCDFHHYRSESLEENICKN